MFATADNARRATRLVLPLILLTAHAVPAEADPPTRETLRVNSDPTPRFYAGNDRASVHVPAVADPRLSVWAHSSPSRRGPDVRVTFSYATLGADGREGSESLTVTSRDLLR